MEVGVDGQTARAARVCKEGVSRPRAGGVSIAKILALKRAHIIMNIVFCMIISFLVDLIILFDNYKQVCNFCQRFVGTIILSKEPPV